MNGQSSIASALKVLREQGLVKGDVDTVDFTVSFGWRTRRLSIK